MIYCSSGLNRIIVRANGDIHSCYSKNNLIGNIKNFNINNLKATYCDQENCTLCDKNFIQTNKCKHLIKKNN